MVQCVLLTTMTLDDAAHKGKFVVAPVFDFKDCIIYLESIEEKIRGKKPRMENLNPVDSYEVAVQAEIAALPKHVQEYISRDKNLLREEMDEQQKELLELIEYQRKQIKELSGKVSSSNDQFKLTFTLNGLKEEEELRVKELFGYGSFKFLKAHVKTVKVFFNAFDDNDDERMRSLKPPDDFLSMVDEHVRLINGGDATIYNPDGMTNETQILITLYFAFNSPKLRTFAGWMGCSYAVISKILKKWRDRLNVLGRYLSVNPLSREEKELLKPVEIVEKGQDKLLGSVDGTDVPICRLGGIYKRKSWSDKIQSSAVRSLCFVHPTGFPLVLTSLYLGRSSEISILRLYGDTIKNIVANDTDNNLILFDKGFKGSHELLGSGVLCSLPSICYKGQFQFKSREIEENRNNAGTRWSAERFWSTMKKSTSIGSTSPSAIAHLDGNWWIAFTSTIFNAPTYQPTFRSANGEEFVSILEMYLECKSIVMKKQNAIP